MIRSLAVRIEAREEIDEEFEWYERQRVGLGEEFLGDLRNALQAIRTDPEWSAILYRGIRAKPLTRFPHIVYFRATDDRIDVIAVQHGRRNPRRWRSRS